MELVTRIQHYHIFYSLGIPKKTLKKMIALEYAVCFLGSIVTGIVLGSVFVFFVKKELLTQIVSGKNSIGSLLKVTGYAAGIFFVIVLIASLINYHFFEGKNILKEAVKAQEGEGIPRHFLWAGIIPGAAVVILVLFRYWDYRWSEAISLCIWLLLGCSVLLFCIFAREVLAVSKRDKVKQNKLLSILPWRYRFRSNYLVWYVLFALHILVLSVYLPQLSTLQIAPDTPTLYPYDFVCMSDESDQSYFEELEQKYDIQVQSYPMVRITTPLREMYSWRQAANNQFMATMWPQGQHIAITESTYKELKEANGMTAEPLDLKGEDIHVVFQQDISVKAHPLEWYLNDKKPRFRFGYPLKSYFFGAREITFPQFELKSSERSILTGMLQEGQQENIVVFSDSYQLPQEEGARILRVVTGNEKNVQQVNDELQTFKKKHQVDSSWDERIQPYYEKQTMMANVNAERVLKKVSYLFLIVCLLLSSFYLFYVKYELEMSEIKEKFDLLKCMGMSQKKQDQLLKREMSMFILGSYIAAVPVSLLISAGICKIRMFTVGEQSAFIAEYGVLFAVYTLVYLVGMYLLGIYCRKSILKQKQGRRTA